MSLLDCGSPARVPAAVAARHGLLSDSAAEQAATAWLAHVGHAEALAMMSTGAEAVGRAAVQHLHAAAVGAGRSCFFFAARGFTDAALEWADLARVPLLRFGADAEPVPMNAAARAVLPHAA
jgi:hypothetical protein